MVSLITIEALKTTEQTLKDLFLENEDLSAKQRQAITLTISTVTDELQDRKDTVRIVNQKPTAEYAVVNTLAEQMKL